ncbi:hypothetical protein ACFLYO_03205 [Chloroflexota bacterium]
MLVDQGHVLHAEWVRQDLEREVLQGLLVEEALRYRPANPPLARLGRLLVVVGERLQGERAVVNSITELLESNPVQTAH